MGNGASTIVNMAKKNSKRGRPSGRRPTTPVTARVDPELAIAWEEYVSEIEPKTSGSAMIELLMKRHLREAGMWPPKQQKPEPDAE